MSTARDVQLGLIEGMDRPVGPLPQSVMRGDNADLIAGIADLYLTGSVLDVTYGRGAWWRRFTPDPFAWHDLALDRVDFRALPEQDRSWDTVCFDPPYIGTGLEGTTKSGDDWQDRYGIGARNGGDSGVLIPEGLAEACRVARQWVLVKCMEWTAGSGPRGFQDTPTLVTNRAAACGWVKWDQIVHFSGPGPGGHNIWTAKRARRAHSYLLVFAHV